MCRALTLRPSPLVVSRPLSLGRIRHQTLDSCRGGQLWCPQIMERCKNYNLPFNSLWLNQYRSTDRTIIYSCHIYVAVPDTILVRMEYLWIHISSFHVIIGSKIQKDIPVLSSTHGTDGKLISIPEIYWKTLLISRTRNYPKQNISSPFMLCTDNCSIDGEILHFYAWIFLRSLYYLRKFIETRQKLHGKTWTYYWKNFHCPR